MSDGGQTERFACSCPCSCSAAMVIACAYKLVGAAGGKTVTYINSTLHTSLTIHLHQNYKASLHSEIPISTIFENACNILFYA